MPATPILRAALILAVAAGAALPSRSAAQDGAPLAALPAGAAEARARLDASPRHGEWAMVAAGGQDSVRAWVVYPERRDRAPVVVVIHEIYGLTDWIRAVADDGFIAVAPDLLTGKAVATDARGEPERQAAVAAIRALGKVYEPHVFEGAGHGFLRQQDGHDGRNLAATRAAWPLTVRWFREHLGR